MESKKSVFGSKKALYFILLSVFLLGVFGGKVLYEILQQDLCLDAGGREVSSKLCATPQNVESSDDEAKKLAQSMVPKCEGSECAKVAAKILRGADDYYLEIIESDIPDDALRTQRSLYLLKMEGSTTKVFDHLEIDKKLYSDHACRRSIPELNNTFHQKPCK